MIDPRVEAAAREFHLYDKAGSWRLGLLIARSVQPGRAGRPPRNRRDHDDSGKLSARAFAKLANTSSDRVLRYWRAWQRAAADGWVPDATELHPSSEIDLDRRELPDWSVYFDGRGRRTAAPEGAPVLVGNRWGVSEEPIGGYKFPPKGTPERAAITALHLPFAIADTMQMLAVEIAQLIRTVGARGEAGVWADEEERDDLLRIIKEAKAALDQLAAFIRLTDEARDQALNRLLAEDEGSDQQ